MSTPKHFDSDPLTALNRDVALQAEQVRRLRTDSALSSLPASLVRVVTEQDTAGLIRVGVVNRASGGTAWITGWF